MLRRPDYGLTERDLELFMAKMLAECVEKAWIAHHTPLNEHREELQADIMQTLVSCYMAQMWAEAAFKKEEPIEESLEEDEY